MKPIRFKPHQHAELLKLGLAPEAIDRIELEGLPLASAYLEREPPHADVRAELRRVADALSAARDSIERLLDATPAVPHLNAARRRISGGGRRHAMGGMQLDETSKSLATAIDVVSEAVARMPSGPLRHQAADPLSIKLICRAANFGSIIAGVGPEPACMKPSSSPTSTFRRIIGICYEAMGAKTVDPERAIKAYVKSWRTFSAYLGTIEVGQNAPEESDVPS